MAVHSKFFECMPEGYGFVVLTAVGSCFVNMWMAMNVVRARKEFGIKYPLMYSPENEKFNCIQRAHQNTLEGHPQFLLLLMVGGLYHPRCAAGAGVLFLLGRIAFAIGYSTGEPEKRKYGGFGYIGMLALLGNTVAFAVQNLRCSGYFGGHKCC